MQQKNPRNITANPYYSTPYDGAKSSSSVRSCSQEGVTIVFLLLSRLHIVSLVQIAAFLLSSEDAVMLPCGQDYHLSAWKVFCGP